MQLQKIHDIEKEKSYPYQLRRDIVNPAGQRLKHI